MRDARHEHADARAVGFLAAAAVGGVAWVFIYPLLSGERQGRAAPRQRRAQPSPRPRARPTRRQKSRREQVEDTLKELEARAREDEERCRCRCASAQAGLTWSTQQVLIISGVLGVVLLRRRFRDRRRPAAALPAWPSPAGFGLPRWLLSLPQEAPRERSSCKHFPDAVDVIVRGIKAGLPLFESPQVIAADAPEPVASEFKAIVETQAIGMPLGEACAKLYERMPLPEANFFGIVIAIQQKAGGNLSEALGNLSQGAARPQEDEGQDPGDVDGSQGLRRHHRRAAARRDDPRLPHEPDYIELLWTHPTGQLMLVGCVVWMSIGILVMKKMINFDF